MFVLSPEASLYIYTVKTVTTVLEREIGKNFQSAMREDAFYSGTLVQTIAVLHIDFRHIDKIIYIQTTSTKLTKIFGRKPSCFLFKDSAHRSKQCYQHTVLWNTRS